MLSPVPITVAPVSHLFAKSNETDTGFEIISNEFTVLNLFRKQSRRLKYSTLNEVYLQLPESKAS